MYSTVNGTALFFDVQGSALESIDGVLREKPVIIALHGGLGFDHGYLRDGLGPLADLAQVIYVDLRSQGRSERSPLETATLEQMADDVVALAQNLGVTKPFVFGHSAGGFVALHIALRYPGFAKGLLLAGTSPTVLPIEDVPGTRAPSLADRASPEALEAASRLFGGNITRETVFQFFEKVGPYYAGPANERLTARLMRSTLPNIDMMKHFMTELAPKYDLRGALDRISAPALVMVGSYDWVCPPRASRCLVEGIEKAIFVEFKHSGHFLFSEEPDEFRNVVTDFFGSVDWCGPPTSS
ncbi:alpha/beta hydrolase [Rhizobium sp. 2MFCol3.1]|uniref:alpha/beta fold hydrolase n=1 Tax=Rhizobium sp. 2MFCol3.1 TaxID=1246459 RepID=UPI0009DA69B4|nr:alpha/beta hydrolase [Rhizobium sp. 2MFCol3.1]